MISKSAFQLVPCQVRADPTVHLTPDAPVATILEWLSVICPEEEIDYVVDHLPHQTLIIFDRPYWAAITYASWPDWVEKLQ
ncbi:hypothetical protein [Novosphingobium sp. TCA1]|uniref:hypothetical protein n=1 Tax=Novosphingobium sp. TCA1 TaxID=2682474 RepID=UPI001305E94B|nr:hypothetical protein [Novosphingobium sp. TCA1]GFE77715.1 hypothetical protein NTCA1_53640 [Novosphingobium sp. TCA1]